MARGYNFNPIGIDIDEGMDIDIDIETDSERASHGFKSEGVFGMARQVRNGLS